jgi:hypothetical protein
MLFRSLRTLLILGLFVAPLAACDSGGTLDAGNTSPGSTDNGPVGEDGEIDVVLRRAKMAKSVSSAVDSAFVRVWKSDIYNKVKYVRVPDPGGTTQVSLKVPASTGYRAGVLAVESDSAQGDAELPYAVGTTENTFKVAAGSTTSVSPPIRSLQPTVQLPSNVTALKKDTIRVEFGRAQGYSVENYDVNAITDTTRAFDTYTSLDDTYLTGSDSTVTEGFEVSAPSNTGASKLYLKIYIDYDDRNWTDGTGGVLDYAFYPSPGDGFNGTGTYEIPIGDSGDSGTVVITFDEDGDRVRRVIR